MLVTAAHTPHTHGEHESILATVQTAVSVSASAPQQINHAEPEVVGAGADVSSSSPSSSSPYAQTLPMSSSSSSSSTPTPMGASSSSSSSSVFVDVPCEMRGPFIDNCTSDEFHKCWWNQVECIDMFAKIDCGKYKTQTTCNLAQSMFPIGYDNCTWRGSCYSLSDVKIMTELEYAFFLDLKNSGYPQLESWNETSPDKYKCKNLPKTSFNVFCSAYDRVVSLSLSSYQKPSLPESLGNLNALTYLSISSSNLTTLPYSSSNLTSLLTFLSYSNPSLSIPASFVNLPNLLSMLIDNSKITSLPEDFGNLTKLTSLQIFNTPISQIPLSFKLLTNLKVLKLVGDKNLTSLPEIFSSSMSKLTNLVLQNNKLASLPSGISTLSKLVYLFVNDNEIINLPLLSGLPNLNQLNVANNIWLNLVSSQISTPESFLQLECSNTCSTAFFKVKYYETSCSRSALCACTKQKIKEECEKPQDGHICWWDGNSKCYSNEITPTADCSIFTPKGQAVCESGFWSKDNTSICLWNPLGYCVNANASSACPTFNLTTLCTGAIKRGAVCYWCSYLDNCQVDDENVNCEKCEKAVTSTSCPTDRCTWCENEGMCKGKGDTCKQCEGKSQKECSTILNCKYCADSPVQECLNSTTPCKTCFGRNNQTCTADQAFISSSSSSSSTQDQTFKCKTCPQYYSCLDSELNCASTCYNTSYSMCSSAGCKPCSSSQTCQDSNDVCKNCSMYIGSSSCNSHPGCKYCISSNSCQEATVKCVECSKFTSTTCKGGCLWCAVDNLCSESFRQSCSSCSSLKSISKCGNTGGACSWCPSSTVCLAKEKKCRSCNIFVTSSYCTLFKGCFWDTSTGSCKPVATSSGQESASSVSAVVIVVPLVLVVILLIFVIVFRKRIASKFTKKDEEDTQENTTVSLSKFTSIELGASKITSTSSLDVSSMKLVDLSEFGLTLEEKATLEFGDTHLEVLVPFQKKITFKNNSEKTFKGIIQYSPDEDNHQITFAKDSLKISSGQKKVISATLVMRCTSSLGGQLQLVSEKTKEYSVLPIKGQAAPSCFLSIKEISIGRKLGQGGFGAVYQGKYKNDDVAIKQFNRPEGDAPPDSTDDQMENEILLMSKLRSPYVVSFFGVVNAQAQRFIVMEYCQYGTMRSYLEKGKASIAFKVMTCIDVAKGLHFLHSNKVIHRDIKPENVLLVSISSKAPVRGKLSDFGTSRMVSDIEKQRLTKGVGTPLFMSPELLENKSYSLPSDIYALALTFWFAWSQTDPFLDIKNNFTLYQKVMDGVRPAVDPKCPYKDLIVKMWNANPEARPTAEEVQKEMEEFERAFKKKG